MAKVGLDDIRAETSWREGQFSVQGWEFWSRGDAEAAGHWGLAHPWRCCVESQLVWGTERVARRILQKPPGRWTAEVWEDDFLEVFGGGQWGRVEARKAVHFG